MNKPNPSSHLPAPMAISAYATRPTRFTLFLREFLPWQLIRFAVINLKIVRMTLRNERSH